MILTTLLAQSTGGSTGTGLKLNISQAISKLPDNPFKYTDLGVFISNAISLALIGSGLFALLYLIWGAFDWIISGGDKGAIEGARNKIIHSIIGLCLVAGAWAIFTLVQFFLGLELLKTTNPGGYFGGSSYSGSGGGGGGGGGSGGGRAVENNNLRLPGAKL